MSYRLHPFRSLDVWSVARFDPMTMMVVSAGMTMAGSAVQAGGTLAGGNTARQAGLIGQQQEEFKAKQLDMRAQESRAASQRSALDKRRETELLTSKLIARGGPGASSDVGIVDLAGDIAQRGEFEALTEMYKGENRARGDEDAALGARLTGHALAWEGEQKKRASKTAALGTIIGGAGSAFKMFAPTPAARV